MGNFYIFHSLGLILLSNWSLSKTVIKEIGLYLLFEQKGKLEILDSDDFDADEVAENLLSVTQHVQPFV